MQLNISKHHTTHLLRVKSLRQNFTICRQFRSTLNKQEGSGHILQLWVSPQLDAQVHQFDCEVDSGAGCNKLLPLYIYRSLFRDKNLEYSTVLINGYGDSPVENEGSCTTVLLTGNQACQCSVSGHRHK